MSRRFARKNKKIYNINYHIIFVPKYRKSILRGNFRDIIMKSLIYKANELEIEIINYEIMDDHVHLFIKCGPNNNVSDIVKHLKGYSSYMLRKSYPFYRKKYKSFWSPSYYCESIGHISASTINKYINDQTKKGNSSHG